jgi:hypothetical protein
MVDGLTINNQPWTINSGSPTARVPALIERIDNRAALWWPERGGTTRSHSEPGSETLQRRWYWDDRSCESRSPPGIRPAPSNIGAGRFFLYPSSRPGRQARNRQIPGGGRIGQASSAAGQVTRHPASVPGLPRLRLVSLCPARRRACGSINQSIGTIRIFPTGCRIVSDKVSPDFTTGSTGV